MEKKFNTISEIKIGNEVIAIVLTKEWYPVEDYNFHPVIHLPFLVCKWIEYENGQANPIIEARVTIAILKDIDLANKIFNDYIKEKHGAKISKAN